MSEFLSSVYDLQSRANAIDDEVSRLKRMKQKLNEEDQLRYDWMKRRILESLTHEDYVVNLGFFIKEWGKYDKRFLSLAKRPEDP